jgi:hypothetical protein
MGAVQLSCQPSKAGNTLVFPYKVENQGIHDVYVMDAMPRVTPGTQEPFADDQAAVVLLGPGDNAVLGKFLAPLPTDRRVAMPALPLARHLPPGRAFERCLKIAMPMAETSPYFGDLPLRQYDVVDIKGAVFMIGYWVAGTDGLAAMPAEYAPGLFHVVTRNSVRSAMQVTQRFPATGLHLFKRTDSFPRAFAAARAPRAADAALAA